MTEWRINPDAVLKLLDAYKRCECLWNFKSSDYKQTDVRQNAWLRLAEMFNTTPEMVKRKIKYLRTTYVSEKRKVIASMKSGDPNSIHRPRLFYYRKLRFLDPVIFLRGNDAMECMGRSSCIEEPSENIDEEAAENATEESDPSQNFEHISLRPSSDSTGSNKIKYDSTDMEYDDNIMDQHTDYVFDEENDTSSAPIKSDMTTAAAEYDLSGSRRSVAATRATEVSNLHSQFGMTVALQLDQLLPLEATAAMSTIHRYLSKRIMRSLTQREQQAKVSKTSRQHGTPSYKFEVISTLSDSGQEYL